MSDEPTSKTVSVVKKHAVKAAGGLTLSGVMVWVGATFAPLADYKGTRVEVQELREKVAVLEWAHEKTGRHNITAFQPGFMPMYEWRDDKWVLADDQNHGFNADIATPK